MVEVAHDASDEQADTLVGMVVRATTPTVIVATRALRLARLWAGQRVAELHVSEPGAGPTSGRCPATLSQAQRGPKSMIWPARAHAGT